MCSLCDSATGRKRKKNEKKSFSYSGVEQAPGRRVTSCISCASRLSAAKVFLPPLEIPLWPRAARGKAGSWSRRGFDRRRKERERGGGLEEEWRRVCKMEANEAA